MIVAHAAQAATDAPLTIWGTIPSWIAAIFSAGSFGVVASGVNTWRKNSTLAKKVADEGDAGIRDHYSEELKALRQQILESGRLHAERAAEAERRYREGLRAADERHDAAMSAADERERACQGEVRELRREILKLSDEVIGLRRQLGQVGTSAVILATHAPSELVQEAAARAVEALDKLDHDRSRHDGD